MIPEEVIAEVKRRADIGQVIGRTVKLKRSGRNLVGLCPFHAEKTPSFNVRPDEGFYKCFGCGAAGDVFTFVEQTTGQRFIDVLRQLAAETGVVLPEVELSPDEQRRRDERARLLRVLELAQLFFRQKLLDDDEGRVARLYLKEQRGLEDEIIASFGIGYGGARDAGLVSFLAAQGVDDATMQAAGVVAAGRSGSYDFFRQRITFPVRGRRGEVLTFGGRAFGKAGEGRPKYVNGPRTAVYDKSRDLYGIYEALPQLKRGRPCVLVEGYLDVIAVHRVGLSSAVAPCGTSLTPLHVEEIARHAKTLVVCMDADDAGKSASERAVLMALRQGLDVRLCDLVEKDPDQMVKNGEGALLREKLEGAKDAVDALVERLLEKAVGRIGNRTAALESALPFLAALPDDRLSSQAIVGRVAQVMGVERSSLVSDVRARGKKLLAGILGGGREPEQKRRDEPAPSTTTGSSSPAPNTPPPTSGTGSTSEEDATRSPEKPTEAPHVQRRASPVARALEARPKAVWTEAEKSLAKALLCQPQLAPRCGLLVDAFKNRELRRFVVDLTDALVRYYDGTPRDVLLKVAVPPAVARIYADIFTKRGVDDPDAFLPEGAAARIIEDFVLTLEKRPLEQRLGEVQRAIQTASDRLDHETVRHLMATQSAIARRLAVPEGRKEPRLLQAPSAQAGAAGDGAQPVSAAEPVGAGGAKHDVLPAPREPDHFVPDPIEGDDDVDAALPGGALEPDDEDELW